MMSSLIGMAGLGVESGLWFTEKRGLQTQADAAAIAGAYQLAASASNANIVATAKTEAGFNGFVTNSSNTITINTPPASGPLAGNASAVEAVLTTPRGSILSGLFLPGGVTIGARAVARVVTVGSPCVLALNPTNTTGLSFQGNTTVTMPNCIMAANSPSTRAISLQGNPAVTAQNVYAVGGLSQGGNANLVAAGLLPLVGQPPIVDPYAALPINLPGGCPGLTLPSSGVVQPGLYCGGMSLKNASYTLNSGIYYVYNGDFAIGANANVRVQAGGGVTIILTGSPSSKIGVINIGSNSTSNLTPSTSGTYKGILFYVDRNAPSNHTQLINGGPNMTLGGLIYAPSQAVTFSGNTGANCLDIIAYTVTFTGNSTIDNSGCPALGVTPITIKGVTMAE